MRSYEHMDSSFSQIKLDLIFLALGNGSGEQFDPKPQREQEFSQCLIMLICQDFERRQKYGLSSESFERIIGGCSSDDSLSASDISLQQS